MKLWLALAVVLACAPALARDNGQWAQADPAIKQWIENLKNKNNVLCCSNADGYDVQWETRGDKYRVFIYGTWWEVPPIAILDVPNRLGAPRVWYITLWHDGKPTPSITCFLPGALL
jgi:hypothetical protein